MFRVEVKESHYVERPKREWVRMRDEEVLVHDGDNLPQYGYAPEIMQRVKEESTILVMEVETLDLKGLTKAIQKAPKTEVQGG